MKITVDSIELKEDQVEMVMKLKGSVKDGHMPYDMPRTIQDIATRAIAETLTKQYLSEHMHKLMAEIDKQQILNMIVLNSANRFTGQQ